jgi:hypothetical protein
VFLVQPFNSVYNSRFKTLYAPAIVAAGLTPYRVDRDPSVEVTIDAIERELNNSSICLAEITEDRPNVWLEVGYALACKTPVVFVCENGRRSGYPFDIQHRHVISYKYMPRVSRESAQIDICNRIVARLKNPEQSFHETGSLKSEDVRKLVGESTAAAITGQGIFATASVEQAKRLLGL